MIRYTTTIQKFDKKGEKTRWSYIEISATQAQKLKPGVKVSYRVKGTLDHYAFGKTALLPMGNGSFIMPLNATMRKAIGKNHPDKITVTLEVDERPLKISPDLLKCLKEEPLAMAFFNSLPRSHQLYYSKWIESAKTVSTKSKRIVMSMIGFSKRQSYNEMMRENKGRKF